MDIKLVFGKNVHQYRKERKLSQEKLSELLDITPKHLSSIENGSSFVSAELLEKLSRTLAVSPSSLFYSAEDSSTENSGSPAFLDKVDSIVSQEIFQALSGAVTQIKMKIRQ
ncbi:MAG: helix-turn-helix transcriptional regulator [Treponema sp.]|nr:helix-turn-helix transcriptional regulator [Treponema sp.]